MALLLKGEVSSNFESLTLSSGFVKVVAGHETCEAKFYAYPFSSQVSSYFKFVHVNVPARMWVCFSASLQLSTQGQLLCTHVKVHEESGGVTALV